VINTTGLTYQQTMGQNFNGAGVSVIKLKLSDYAGSGQLWYNPLVANTLGSWGNNATEEIKIYQSLNATSNGLLVNSYVSAVSVAENTMPAGVKIIFTNFFGAWGDVIMTPLTLTWQHNPANGVYYTIYNDETFTTVHACHLLGISYPINTGKVADCINANTGQPIPSPTQNIVVTPVTFIIDGKPITVPNNNPSANCLAINETDGCFVTTGSTCTINPFVTPTTTPTPHGFSGTQSNTLTTVGCTTQHISGYINQNISVCGLEGSVTQDTCLFIHNLCLAAYQRPPSMLEYYTFGYQIASGFSLGQIISFCQNTFEGLYVNTNGHPLILNTTPYQAAPTLTLLPSTASTPFQNTIPVINTASLANNVVRGTTTPSNTSTVMQVGSIEPNNGIVSVSSTLSEGNSVLEVWAAGNVAVLGSAWVGIGKQ
jgi:hypothetical protein